MPHTTSVLICGAGPTGLALAVGLARRGTSFIIIDDGAAPGEWSRAMVVQARTLELYRQFGFAEAMIREGVKVETLRLREGRATASHELVAVHLGDFGEGLSPYPFALAYPQDDHERFLVRQLATAGGQVTWNTRLLSFTQDAGGVVARVTNCEGIEEEVRADYICGCDGARSVVRQALGLDFPGGTYAQRFFVADTRIAGGGSQDLVVNLGENILVLMLPVRLSGMQRLIGIVPEALNAREDLTFDDIRGEVEHFLGITVTDVNWFSVYTVHHRVAERFQVERAFLLGDAGHIHSPAGGQGMNTGIGDAINLAWKLAMVIQGRADASLLTTYESERIAFARLLVATTDRAFRPIVMGGVGGEIIRRVVAPLVVGIATQFEAGKHALFRTISQTRIRYPDSALSEGVAGAVQGGDRLPWTGGRGPDNHAPLDSLDWQVHVYGDADADFVSACEKRGMPVHVFSWSRGAEDAGLARDGAYCIRPDGYVGLAMSLQRFEELNDYLERQGLH